MDIVSNNLDLQTYLNNPFKLMKSLNLFGIIYGETKVTDSSVVYKNYLDTQQEISTYSKVIQGIDPMYSHILVNNVELNVIGFWCHCKHYQFMLQLACHFANVVPVIIDPDLSLEDLKTIVVNYDLSTLYVSHKNYLTLVDNTADLKCLKRIIILEKDLKLQDLKDIKVLCMDFMSSKENDKMKENLAETDASKENEILFISVSYTKKGTIDGVVVDIKSFTQRIKDSEEMFRKIFERGDRFYSWMSLHHLTHQLVLYWCFLNGVVISFYFGEYSFIRSDLNYIYPNVILVNPRFLILLKNQIDAYLDQNCSTLYMQAYRKGLEMKLQKFAKTGHSSNILFDTFIFRYFRQKLGGSLKYMLCIGSDIPQEILNEIQCILNVKIIRLYGMKELIGPVLMSNLAELHEPKLVTLKVGETDYIIKEEEVDALYRPYLQKYCARKFGYDEEHTATLKFVELKVGFDRNVVGYLSDFRLAINESYDSEDNFDSLFESTKDIFISNNYHYTFVVNTKEVIKGSQGEYIPVQKIEFESTNKILEEDRELDRSDFLFVIENSPEYPIPIAFMFYKGDEDRYKDVLEKMQDFFTNYNAFEKPYWRPYPEIELMTYNILDLRPDLGIEDHQIKDRLLLRLNLYEFVMEYYERKMILKF